MRPVRLVARRYGFDLLIVLGSVVGALAVALRPDHTLGPGTAPWLGALAAAVVPLPLLARHRAPFGAPLAVWVLAGAASFVDGRLPVSVVSLFVTGMAATFLLGALPDARAGRVGLATALGGALVIVANDPAHGDTDYLFTPALFAIAWLTGLTVRERARGAVLEERVRIARELHDVVAHHVSMIGVQAGAARLVVDRDPGKAKQALATIEASSREAVTELHHLLGFLRRDGDDEGTAPAPRLSELPRLAASMADSNLAVEVRIEGEQRSLPPTIDVSAYRIVQEALTNTLKHSAASRADVRLRYRPDELEVVVVDDGRGEAGNGSAPGGLGLVGMRERAAAHGGQLSAGPLAGGGYRVVVTLPTGAGAP
jgi:signal transduction histidine kinase